MKQPVVIVVLAFLCSGLDGWSPLAQGTIPSGAVSPRLAALSKEVGARTGSALGGFWQDVIKQGAPLIEPITGDDQNVLVTFLWRSTQETRVVVMADFGNNVPSLVLTRLLDTDVWYRTYRMARDSRFLYQLSVDDPNFPFEGEEDTKYPTRLRADPLNHRRYDFNKPNIFSVVELPGAPSLELSRPNPTVPHGVLTQFVAPLTSKILGNERPIWVYKPPHYTDAAPERYPLLIFGASYINQIPLPVILDNLIAQRRIPPAVAVFVGFPPSAPGQNVQDEESGGGGPFGDFIAKELLPWVRDRVHVATDPRRVVIGGASAGGHSAACVGLQHPEAIGNVIAQSGAFWRGIGHTARYWSDRAHDGGREGFARAVASRSAAPTAPMARFYLTVGRLESRIAFSDGVIPMLLASRHVRDVLQAKGYDVTLRETSGGHDPYNWAATLPDALITLLGSGSPSRVPKD